MRNKTLSANIYRLKYKNSEQAGRRLSQVAKQITFTGRVQGVGFRFTAYHLANRNHLTGQVRNMPDGSVEMIACGRQENIDNCIKELKGAFPGGIAEIKTEAIPQSKKYKEFKITF